MSVVSLVKDLSMKKFNGITAVCFVDSVYSMLLYLLVYGKKQYDARTNLSLQVVENVKSNLNQLIFLFQKQSQLKYRVS